MSLRGRACVEQLKKQVPAGTVHNTVNPSPMTAPHLAYTSASPLPLSLDDPLQSIMLGAQLFDEVVMPISMPLSSTTSNAAHDEQPALMHS